MIAFSNTARSRVKPLLTRPETETTAAMSDLEQRLSQHLGDRFLRLGQIPTVRCMSSNRKTMKRSGTTDDCGLLPAGTVVVNRSSFSLDSRTSLNAESGDDLRFAVVKNLEVFFFEVSDGVACVSLTSTGTSTTSTLAFNGEDAILSRSFFLLCGQRRSKGRKPVRLRQ